MVDSRNRRHIGSIGVVAWRDSRPLGGHIGSQKSPQKCEPQGHRTFKVSWVLAVPGLAVCVLGKAKV